MMLSFSLTLCSISSMFNSDVSVVFLPYATLPSCFLLYFNFFLSSFYSVVIISFFLCPAFFSWSHTYFVLFSCHSFPSFLHSTVILSLFYSWFYSVFILSFLLLPFFLFLFRGHSICYFTLSSFLYFFLFSTTPKRGCANCIS